MATMICGRCGGRGSLQGDHEPCASCSGRGRNPGDTTLACASCGGSGRSGSRTSALCPVCRGLTTVTSPEPRRPPPPPRPGRRPDPPKPPKGRTAQPVGVLRVAVFAVVALLAFRFLASSLDGEPWIPLALAAGAGLLAARHAKLTLSAFALVAAWFVLGERPKRPDDTPPVEPTGSHITGDARPVEGSPPPAWS